MTPLAQPFFSNLVQNTHVILIIFKQINPEDIQMSCMATKTFISQTMRVCFKQMIHQMNACTFPDLVIEVLSVYGFRMISNRGRQRQERFVLNACVLKSS